MGDGLSLLLGFLLSGEDDLVCLFFLPPRGYMSHEAHCSVAVAKSLITPGSELDRVVVEGNASPSIKVRRVDVAVKVAEGNLCSPF